MWGAPLTPPHTTVFCLTPPQTTVFLTFETNILCLLSVNEYFYKDMTSDESPVIQLIRGERKAPAELGIKTTTIFLFCISKGIWEKKGERAMKVLCSGIQYSGEFLPQAGGIR